MNPPSIVQPESLFESQAIAPAPERRSFHWSVRRELWENRFLYIGPLIVAAVVLFATLIGTLGLPKKMRALATLEPARQHASVAGALDMAPAPIMLAALLVGVFYCLDALYGERRDRSILFWKSLPVSDRTTVLSKAIIPLAVLPLIAWALSVIVQIILFFASNAVLVVNGISPARLWTEFRFFQGLLIMIYGLSVHALWFAPIYAWLLLVSAWAKRAPFLWAVLPLLAISAVERIIFDTWTFMTMLQNRVGGAMKVAFSFTPDDRGNIDRLSQLTPGRFLTTPGLWIGLLFAAMFLAAAVRLRRNRAPI
ncbi:MAG TPA: ABC transporter permease [Thermoanaerobaculia bacterium]|nr:ABC transporter permease [Thermoanaerobaculia bacterium]